MYMNRINEIGDTPKGRGWLGAVQARAKNRRDRARLNAEIPKSEREKESKKQEAIMKRASDTAFKNTNASELMTHRQMRAGANDYYRKNNYSDVPIEWDEYGYDDYDYQNESKKMNKKLIRLTESDLHKIVRESVNKILSETKKKDPMQQWFKDMDDIQKHRDNMEYITKGGRKPKHWKKTTNESLHRIVKDSVGKVLNEISFKKLADASSAASDRESIFKDVPGYPDTPMRRHYTDDGKLDVAQYEKDSERGIRQSKQPLKFKNAAFTQLSREICGEDDFFAFLANYIQTNGMDGTIQKLIQDYKDGENYILNNKTKWSGRN